MFNASICFDNCLRAIEGTYFNKERSSYLSLKNKRYLFCHYKQNFLIKCFVQILFTHVQFAMKIAMIIHLLPLKIDISPNKNDEYG